MIHGGTVLEMQLEVEVEILVGAKNDRRGGLGTLFLQQAVDSVRPVDHLNDGGFVCDSVGSRLVDNLDLPGSTEIQRILHEPNEIRDIIGLAGQRDHAEAGVELRRGRHVDLPVGFGFDVF